MLPKMRTPSPSKWLGAVIFTPMAAHVSEMFSLTYKPNRQDVHKVVSKNRFER
jgi:hypothetical protein